MAGIAAIIVKIMPDSPQAQLLDIEHEARRKLESHHAKNISCEHENIAFGLKAIKIKFAWPEEKDTDVIETMLSSIPHVSSAVIEDYRRAFG